MKYLLILAAALLAISGTANAQSAKGTANAGATSRASNLTIVNGTNPTMGAVQGAGSAAASATTGGFFNPQWVLGQTTASSAASTFNDCGASWKITLGPADFGQAFEAERCVRQRLGQEYIKQGNVQLANEIMCGIDYVAEADRTSQQNRCPVNRAKVQTAAVTPTPQPVMASNVLPSNCRLVQPGNYITCE